MTHPTIAAKLAEARTAFFNTNPLIRHQAAHVIVPLLEAMEAADSRMRDLAQRLDALELADADPAGDKVFARMGESL